MALFLIGLVLILHNKMVKLKENIVIFLTLSVPSLFLPIFLKNFGEKLHFPWCTSSTGFVDQMKEFEMSMVGELNYFLGLQAKQLEDGIFISQSKYAKKT